MGRPRPLTTMSRAQRLPPRAGEIHGVSTQKPHWGGSPCVDAPSDARGFRELSAQVQVLPCVRPDVCGRSLPLAWMEIADRVHPAICALEAPGLSLVFPTPSLTLRHTSLSTFASLTTSDRGA